MYTSKRDSYSGGKKFGGGFGGKKPWDRGGRDFGDKPSFKATCAECNASCTVPFRPNGSKPVLCSNCFKGGEKSFGGRSERPFEKRSYTAPGASSNHGVEEQLKAMNSKLDRIIVALDALELE